MSQANFKAQDKRKRIKYQRP